MNNEHDEWPDQCPSDAEFAEALERKFVEFGHRPNESEKKLMIESLRDEWLRLASEREHLVLRIGELYASWHSKVDSLPVEPSLQLRTTLFVDLVGRVVRKNKVPHDRIEQLYKDLLP